jgi:hypothetical protein
MGMDNGSTYVSLYVIFIVHFINVKLFWCFIISST